MNIIFERTFLKFLILFVLFNITIYLFIFFFSARIPFNFVSYEINYHKFYEAPQSQIKPLNLFRALVYSDAQWYLKIAEKGYPKELKPNTFEDKTSFSGLAYAFFPLYPLMLSALNLIFSNIELTAFIASNFLMIINFCSLYFIISSFYSKRFAVKTLFLLFLFPFSIFFRIYYTEGLFLLLLSWFCYFLVKERFIICSIFLGLINVTRGNGMVLFFLFFIYLILNLKKAKLTLERFLYCLILSFLPLGIWMQINYINTGDPLYFFKIQQSWFQTSTLLSPLFANIEKFFDFSNLDFHNFHSSKVDIITAILSLVLIWKSKKYLNPKLWWIALILTLTPLLVKDTISFSRFQSVVFPLFIYSSSILKGNTFILVIILSGISLFLTSILLVNWYWIG